MYENEWLVTTDIERMLNTIKDKISSRKLRLFVCASTRQLWHLMEERSRYAVEIAEKFADGLVTDTELATAREAASNASNTLIKNNRSTWEVIWAADSAVDTTNLTPIPSITASDLHANLLRDICGNPFHPIQHNNIILDPTIVSLAEAAYNNREEPNGYLSRRRLAILSDALEEAGCVDEPCGPLCALEHCGTRYTPDPCPRCGNSGRIPNQLITHLRSRSHHVRGCWALDTILMLHL